MSGFKPSDGDWPCPDPSCGNVNFARRTSCNRCGVDKPMDRKLNKGGIKIGSTAAEKSKGLFSADDWQCGKCGNVNWARRSTCNVCNGPQFSVEEERTGLGGGFNERGNVEYKERVESDDEYDDLGRKKKKCKDPNKKELVANRSILREVEDDEEEEEEEDDDDGDLSKYDLWGDVEDKDDDKKDEEKNGNDVKSSHDSGKRKSSRSRSRSRSRRSRSKDDKKRSRRRSRSSSSSSSSSSSGSRSRSRKKSTSTRRGKSNRSSSSSSSSSRSRSRSNKRDRKSSRRSRSSGKGGRGRKSSSSSGSRSRDRSRNSSSQPRK